MNQGGRRWDPTRDPAEPISGMPGRALDKLRGLFGGGDQPTPLAPEEPIEMPQVPRGDIDLPPDRGYHPNIVSPGTASSLIHAPTPNQVPSGILGAPSVYGKMSVSGQPEGYHMDNRNEGALAGLKAASEGPARFDPSNAELFQMAHRDPSTVAPGSNEMWGHELQSRISDEGLASGRANKVADTISGGLTAQHPAVHAATETAAIQHAYPQQALGEADINVARINAQQRQLASELGVDEATQKNETALVEAAMRGLTEAEGVQKVDPVRQQQWQQLLSMARRRALMSQPQQ